MGTGGSSDAPCILGIVQSEGEETEKMKWGWHVLLAPVFCSYGMFLVSSLPVTDSVTPMPVPDSVTRPVPYSGTVTGSGTVT